MTSPESRAADLQLVTRLASGEEHALAELYDRYSGLVYSLAFSILGDAGDAEEAAADTFLQVWTSATGFDPSRASVAGWLTMIARTRALDRLRARRRREATVAHAATSGDGVAIPLSGADALPDRSSELSEMQSRVGQALAELTPPQRRVIELAYYGGLSHSEIANELGEPLGTVKTRIRAAMEKLRSALGAYVLMV
jgi:RNA polymerase sigma-70 factor (ECF subfamily)